MSKKKDDDRSSTPKDIFSLFGPEVVTSTPGSDARGRTRTRTSSARQGPSASEGSRIKHESRRPLRSFDKALRHTMDNIFTKGEQRPHSSTMSLMWPPGRRFHQICPRKKWRIGARSSLS